MKEKPLKRATRILIFIGAFLSSVCARALPCPSQSDPLGRYTVESAGTGDLGSIWTEGASSGSRIRISVRCDQGLIAQPSVITRCSNGTWSKLWPQCVSRNISGGFLRISPKNISLYVGDHHMFQCSPSYTAWSVYWEKNGQRLVNSNTNYQVGSNLQLRNLQEESEGKYSCVVHDRRGRIMIQADAWLYVIPRINISTVCGTVLFWKENKNLSSLAQEENADTEAEENDDGSIDWSSSSVINEAKRNSGYIVGGYITKHGSAPFMVGMWKRTQLNSWDFHCGATLVDQMWVMTAAHCLFDKSKNALHKEDLKLIFGDFDTRTTNDSEKTHRPSEIIMHGDFESSTLDNDIALIRFEPPLREFTPYIRPVCLAPVGLSRYLTESGTSGRATGWGRLSYHGVTSRFLKAVELPVVNRRTCRESVRKGRLTDNMFCAGHHEGGQDSCRGDSGGPFAVRYEDGRWYQVGIVSWGKGCAEEGRFGFYTHVSRFLKWIRSKNVTIAFSRKVAGQFNEKNDCNAFVYRVRSDINLDLLEESKVNLTCVPSLDDESVQWYIGNDNEEDRRQNPLEDCNLDAILTDTNVTWFKDGQRISSGATEGIIVDQHNRLIIPNLDSRYEGHYACVVRSEENEYFRSETNIRIYRQVTVPPSTAAALGDDVSLVCTSSEINPIFIWTYVPTGLPLYFGTYRATALGVHDNVVLGEATDAQTSVLIINDIELEDEGEYRCGINTQTTFSSATVVFVEVASVPKEIDLISIDDFANYQATCDAIGSKPEESITWILDGVVQSDGIVETDPGVSASPLFDKRSVFTFPASLDNYNVTLVCEIGGHQVTGLNRRETRRVDIQDRFAFFRIAPSNAYDIEKGGHHMFRCSPIDETWSVSWEKDDQPLEDALIVQGNLILSDIQEEDEGKYTCVVRNPIGPTEARVHAWLQLSVPPQIYIFDGIYRQVAVPPSTAVVLGDDVSLVCTSSETSPTFIWTYVPTELRLYFGTHRATALGVHDNVVLGEATDAQTSVLMINDIELEDEGEYRCSINTQTTSSSAIALSVEVASVPKEIDLISIDDFANYQATCDAIGSKPQETITWILDGVVQSDGIVETDPGVSARPLFDKRSVFTFPASLDNYNVTLVCEIGGHQMPSLNRRETRRVDIQDRFAFFRIVPSNAYDMEIGGHHMFLCSPIDETWSVSWEKDDQPLEDALIVRGNLWLIDIQEEDEGKYTCVARDHYGRPKARAHAWLQLSAPPQIDISDVCGTITYWRRRSVTPEPTPEENTESSVDDEYDSSIDWISSFAASGRVVGGYAAEHGSAPYMVRILARRSNKWTTHCGGTLLDQRWIMTVAHCMFDGARRLVAKENLRLLLGDYDVLKQEDSEIEVRPAEIIVHEGFNKRTYDNDIALIRIQPTLRKFTPYIRPICLAPDSLSSRLMTPGNLGRVTGWGGESIIGPLSRFLKAVELPIVDRQTCEESVDRYEGLFTDNMFCAGYYSASRDACSGDTGGPFAVRYDGRWYQLGIMSWGIGCAEKGEYGFYTHVTRFLHWLRSKNITVAYSPNVAQQFSDSQSSNALAFRVRSPSHMTVTAGSSVDLECVPNRADASVEWFIGNSPDPVETLVEGVRILPTRLVFRFDAIRVEYAGAYSCEAKVDDEEGVQVIRADFHLEVTPA